MRKTYSNTDREPSFERDFDSFINDHEEVGVSREMVSLMLQDMINREEGKVAPDTYGADKFFLDGFLNEDMDYDFMFIARDFLKHNFARLKEFNDLEYYGNDRSELSDPERALHVKILDIIYNAAKAGDPYSVALLRLLYKTYHKKEYNQLKRFTKLSVSEMISLSQNEYGNYSYEAMGRIMGMCPLMGIELEEKFSVMYLLLEKRRKEIDQEEEISFLNFKDGLFQECVGQIESWQMELQNASKKKRYPDDCKKYWEVDRFVEAALEHEGFTGDYVYRCNTHFTVLENLFARTLALLKTVYPGKEFTYDEVQTYAHITGALEALTNVSCIMEDSISQLLGLLEDEYMSGEDGCLFRPENVIFRDAKRQEQSLERKPVNVAQVNSTKASEEDYLKEISELRQRLREKERESRYFAEQYNQEKQKLKEMQEILEKRESDHEELITLRNYVYEISEEPAEYTKQSIEEMKAAIKDRRIVIIGGNENWIKKIRQEFPKWRFWGADVSGAVSSTNVCSAEMVYFFTDALGHSNYNKFMKVVREYKVPFSYIHGVSINANIAQIYKDLEG